MELTADIIEGFSNACLVKQYDNATDVPQFHKDLWALCCDKHKFIAAAAPRGHGKSTAVTFAYVLAEVLFRKSTYVLIISDTFSQAGQFLAEIKKELQTNDDIEGLFGKVSFVKDTEDDFICKFDDGHQFRIQAKGAEQKLRGLKWLNKRPDLVVVDDLENDEAVNTRERREKLRKWFFSALVPSLSVNGKIRMVGTILHLDSLLERLMPESQLFARGSAKAKLLITEELKQWTKHELPWKSVKYKAHNEDFSQILWQSRFDKQYWKEKKADFAAQGLSDSYAQEYLNTPLDDSVAFFKKTDFLPIRQEDLKTNLNYYIACDLAVSQSQRADYSVFAVVGVDPDGRMQVKNIIRDRLDSMQIIDTMIMLQKLYSPMLFGVEAGVISKSLGPYLNQAMLERNVFMNLVLLKPSADKVTRARSLQARMRSGAVRFDQTSEWYAVLESEMLQFPRSRHDDQVDALAYIGLLLDQLIVANTNEEDYEEEYRTALHDYGFDQGGRNNTTGY